MAKNKKGSGPATISHNLANDLASLHQKKALKQSPQKQPEVVTEKLGKPQGSTQAKAVLPSEKAILNTSNNAENQITAKPTISEEPTDVAPSKKGPGSKTR